MGMAETETMQIDITAKQKLFLESKKRTVIFQAGIQSGKSVVLGLRAINTVLDGEDFLLVSFSYPTLRDVMLKIIKKFLFIYSEQDPGIHFKINESSMIVTTFRGNLKGNIYLRSGDDPDSLRGIFVHKAGIDEPRNFKTRYIYDIVLGRLSQSKTPQVFLATTSKGKNWVWQLSQDRENVELITQSTLENNFVSEEYKEMLLQNYTSKFARQEIFGEIVDLSSGIINSNWFKYCEYFKPTGHCVRYWDVAVSTKTSADYSAGALLSMQDGKILIHDIRWAKLPYPDLRRLIIETAQNDGVNCIVGIEEAGQQRGFIDDISQAPEMGNYVVRAEKPRGDKYNRCLPWSARAELGNIILCRGAWNQGFADECDSFTPDDTHDHDDRIDAVSGGYGMLQDGGSLIFTTAQIAQEKTQEAIDNDPTGFGRAFLPGVNIKDLFK